VTYWSPGDGIWFGSLARNAGDAKAPWPI
jgi:hypothetical protein